MINHVFISFSAVQICICIYDIQISYIHLHSSPSAGILRTHNVTSLIAQSVEHCTGIAEVKAGFESRLGQFFFSGFKFTTAVYNCDDESCLQTKI